MILGKLQLSKAVAFISEHPEATLGSLSADGLRRVNGPESLRVVFKLAGGTASPASRLLPSEECGTCDKARLGDAIKDRLVQETGDETVCDECQDEIDKLNKMTPEEVIKEAPALAKRITNRAKTKAKKLRHRTAAKIAPGMVSTKIEGWIEDTVKKSTQQAPQEKVHMEFDPLMVTDRLKNRVDLSGMLANRPAAFLVCGGPSLNLIDPALLNQRGLFTMAVNNAAAWKSFRPSAFVCSDPPMKFHLGIWLDPSVMKFIPLPKLKGGRGVLRKKEEDKFTKTDFSACHCPNVWGFLRRSWMALDDTFFTEEGAAWGNLDEGVMRVGLPKTVNTMLLGIRLLYYLGARQIFLVGCDFKMIEGNTYAFDQGKGDDGVSSNNVQYQNVNEWLTKLQEDGIFSKFGLTIMNTSMNSELKAFPKVSIDAALQTALKGFPQCPLDLNGWYEKTVDAE